MHFLAFAPAASVVTFIEESPGTTEERSPRYGVAAPRVEQGPKACDAPTIQETELQDATVKAINLLISCSAAMKEKLAENIAIAIADDNTGDLEEINKILTAKQRELVKLAHAKKDYNDLADEIDKIREKKQRILVAKAETEGYKKRIEELQDFINEGDTELSKYDEKIVMEVYQRNTQSLIIDFRCSLRLGLT